VFLKKDVLYPGNIFLIVLFIQQVFSDMLPMELMLSNNWHVMSRNACVLLHYLWHVLSLLILLNYSVLCKLKLLH